MSGYTPISTVPDDEPLLKPNSGFNATRTDVLAPLPSAIGYPAPGQQPIPVLVTAGPPLGVWADDNLCGCFSDMEICCCGFWCTPCLFGANNVRLSPAWEAVPGARSATSAPMNGIYCSNCWTLMGPSIVAGALMPPGPPGIAANVLSLVACIIQGYIGGQFRTKLRRKYQLPEVVGDTYCPDFVVHLFCQTCAICQEARELKRRGF